MYIFWDNKADSTEVEILTSSTAETGYPDTNTQDPRVSVTWRTTTGSGLSWIKWDAGSGNTITANSIALAGHNFQTGTVVNIKANGTDSWSGGEPVSEQLYINTSYPSDIITLTFTGDSLRYWRLDMTQAASPPAYWELGHVFLGQKFDMPAAELDFGVDKIDTSEVQRSLTGQVYGDHGIVYKEYTLSFPLMDNSNKRLIVAMYEEVKRVKPIYLIVYPDKMTAVADTIPALYGVLSRPPDFRHIQGLRWELGTLHMTEAK